MITLLSLNRRTGYSPKSLLMLRTDTFGYFVFFKSVVQRCTPDHLFQGLATFTAERTSKSRLHIARVYEVCS